MAKVKKTHFAHVEQATESDNTTYVYILCDHDERRYSDEPEYTEREEYVTCKHCIKLLKKENK